MMDPEDEQRKRLLIYFKDLDCVEYKFLQSFFEDINVDEDHEDRVKDVLNVEKIHNENGQEEVNVFEFDHDHHDYEWDDAGHLYWYSTDNNQEEFEDIFDDPVPESEFLDDNPWSILSSLALSPVHSLDNDSVSDCELMSHHILEMQNNEATGECLGSHDGATETVNGNVTETKQWITFTSYDTNKESKHDAAEMTKEPDPVLTVPFHNLSQNDEDGDNMELMQLLLTKLELRHGLAFLYSVTASAKYKSKVSKCVPMSMVTPFVSVTALLGTYHAVYQSHQNYTSGCCTRSPSPTSRTSSPGTSSQC